MQIGFRILFLDYKICHFESQRFLLGEKFQYDRLEISSRLTARDKKRSFDVTTIKSQNHFQTCI